MEFLSNHIIKKHRMSCFTRLNERHICVDSVTFNAVTAMPDIITCLREVAPYSLVNMEEQAAIKLEAAGAPETSAQTAVPGC